MFCDETRRRCLICISLIRDSTINTVPVSVRDTEHITDLSEEDHFTVKMKFYVAVVLTALFVTSTYSASLKKEGSTKGECQIVKATMMKLFLDRAMWWLIHIHGNRYGVGSLPEGNLSIPRVYSYEWNMKTSHHQIRHHSTLNGYWSRFPNRAPSPNRDQSPCSCVWMNHSVYTV